ncbi:hypothetical protein VIGAN_11196900 [Vigna angularis var. angularis]|uniref:Cysteine-rich receptor-like protein kinase n=1 Tax=Vigna angularis var. angularis TaxID=157739 RepID=A0A0S3TBN1_PHAAN|nr:cysteine-rich receptor-like protein kinase 10 [Vigna angularis]BAU02438.1 hypothetical protein VIGAN_11196900 [Vigna angularis var. angularis]
MASYKIFIFFILNFLNFAITEPQHYAPLYQYCSSEQTTDNTSLQLNVKILLNNLSSLSSGHTQYHTNFSCANPSDSIYGLFMCRGDTSPHDCQKCVQGAKNKLSSDCSLSKESVTWYEDCMVRYSTNYFFSTVATTQCNTGKVFSNPESFMQLYFLTMNQTADAAARAPMVNNNTKMFSTREARVSDSHNQTLYCMAQCSPDLSPNDCRTCLGEAIRNVPNSPQCSGVRLGGKVLYPSCNIRYESYPFYLVPPTNLSPELVPETKTSHHADLTFSKDPLYLSHNCSSNKTLASNNTSQISLTTLFSYLSSNATKRKYYEADVNSTVYGLFMCRGDVPYDVCEKCVQNATHRIALECNSLQEGIVWFSQCMVRYSDRKFFRTVKTSPMFSELNFTQGNEKQSSFSVTLAKTLDKVAVMAGDSDERFGKYSMKLTDQQTLYTLAQCTHDLPTDDCKGCLGILIGTEIPWPFLESTAGRVLYPSCNIRFEFSQFYFDKVPSARPVNPESGNKRINVRRIILITVPTIILMTLFFVVFYFQRRNTRKSHATILKENFGHETATLEPLHFNLTAIELATNNFSNENKIGKGGFGEVYKGILPNGRRIAVKRLSKSSKQGVAEFKTEVLLIAKLQHRNLVEFIGFCLEEEEKILIYEYVPNKSLDHFLFDPQPHRSLSWCERYKIIGGIARGIVYLHEHSRLKIIHRDLKPSNVLLDENMTPKISDFGIAKIIEISQDQESTDLIVGTCGYMSPEYAMFGQFSEKSDVFSFGVMVLEIITGRKNIYPPEPHHIADGLLSYVWKQWRAQTPLRTLNSNIRENYAEIEVIKCIQIGLLCVQESPDVRPTMVTIVSYLDGHFSELPTPQRPAFFLHERMDSKSIGRKSSSRRFMNISKPLSINEMSTSECFPR